MGPLEALRSYHNRILRGDGPTAAPRVRAVGLLWELRVLSLVSMEMVTVPGPGCGVGRAFVAWGATIAGDGDYVLVGRYHPAPLGTVQGLAMLDGGYHGYHDFVVATLRAGADLVTTNFRPRHLRAR